LLVVPCADVILLVAMHRVIVTGSGGVPIDFYRQRQHKLKLGGGGVWRHDS